MKALIVLLALASLQARADVASEDRTVEKAIAAAARVAKHPLKAPKLGDQCDHTGHPGICEENWIEELPQDQAQAYTDNQTASDLTKEEADLAKYYARVLKKHPAQAAIIKATQKAFIVKRNHNALTFDLDESFRSKRGVIWLSLGNDDAERVGELKEDSPDAPWNGGLKAPPAYPLNASQDGLTQLYNALSIDPQQPSRVIGIMECYGKKVIHYDNCSVVPASKIKSPTEFDQAFKTDAVVLNLSLADEAVFNDRHLQDREEFAAYYDYVQCTKDAVGAIACKFNDSKITTYDGNFDGWVK